MKIHGHSRHTVDILFPLAVLLVFAVSAFAVLILSAHIYAAQIEHSAISAEQIPVAYLREKLQQNDVAGSITVGELDGENCLIIHSDSDGTATYIYESDGSLKELTARDGVEVHAADGREIGKLDDFDMEEIMPGLFRITCQMEGQEPQSLLFSERSTP